MHQAPGGLRNLAKLLTAYALATLLLLGGCGQASDAHVPPFARQPYEPFSRSAAVAIAVREWRLFGGLVDDEDAPPHPRPPPEQRPEREPGLWQRVGEYWWLGMDAGVPEARWTGKHDQDGHVFPPDEDGHYAWSAAFISYVMRIAGAGRRFAYAPAHATYIDAAARSFGVEQAEPPQSYAPVLGDLICSGRGPARRMRFTDLPVGDFFPAHCAIVVASSPGLISVIGGNVDDSVVLTHVPTTPEGMIAGPDGAPVDPHTAWFVVIRILYDVA
jgi:hypothetical protein